MSPMSTFALVLFVALVGAGAALYALYRRAEDLEETMESTQAKLNAYKKRFEPVINLDEELSRVSKLLQARQGHLTHAEGQLLRLQQQSTQLEHEIALFKETADLADVGIYEPHFAFETPEQYKTAIEAVRRKQKELVTSGEAVKGMKVWHVGGSEKEGEKMIKRLVQLTTRAFNGECEASIANVTWSNIAKMEARMTKAREDINKFNHMNQVVVSEIYLDLKIKELHLQHEWIQKKQDEKEEQADLRRQMREEEKAEREANAAVEKAEREEATKQRQLESARAEAQALATKAAQTQSAQDQQRLVDMQQKLDQLALDLAQAQANRTRAISLAQQTKCGHVYVISNHGSFGEGVYKIGMTRRLDPQDRVDELGDASVPFRFDVHAMIYCQNAPDTERQIHQALSHKRVNRINLRKEFFRVSLEEIEAELKKIKPDAAFVTFAPTDEFLRSKAIILAEGNTMGLANAPEEDPAALLADRQ